MLRLVVLVVVVAATVAGTHACCYTLTGSASQVPVYTWYLDTLSTTPVAPTACVGTLLAKDDSSARPQQCQLLSVWYQSMDAHTAPWVEAPLELAQHVLFTAPCLGFGPYTAGEPASRLLLHRFSDAWLRLQMQCDDSPFPSCVRFGLRLRDSQQQRLTSTLVADPDHSTAAAVVCVRAPTPTPSVPATPQPTPSVAPTATPSALPSYGRVYRADVTFASGGPVMAVQFALQYEELAASNGTRGATFCAVPVFDTSRTRLLTTLVPISSAPRDARDAHLSQSVHALAIAQTRIQVTVLWESGGWCRAQVDRENTVTFIGCRIPLADGAVYDQLYSVAISQMDARTTEPCSLTVMSVALSSPSASSAPRACWVDDFYVNGAVALVTLRNSTHYGEALMRQVECSDGVRRPRVHTVSSLVSLVAHQSIECWVTDEQVRTRAECSDGSTLLTVTDQCDTIQSPTLVVQRRCTSDRGALLLI